MDARRQPARENGYRSPRACNLFSCGKGELSHNKVLKILFHSKAAKTTKRRDTNQVTFSVAVTQVLSVVELSLQNKKKTGPIYAGEVAECFFTAWSQRPQRWNFP